MQYFKLLCMSPLLLSLCITICTTVRKKLDILSVVELLIYSKTYFLIQQNENYPSIYKSITITSLTGFNTALQQYSFIASVQLTSKLRCNNVDTTLRNVVSTLFQRRALTLYQRYATLKIRSRILFHFQRRINVVSTLIHNVVSTLIHNVETTLI